MKQAYIEKRFKPESIERIEQANEIIEEYSVQGYDLTLRQIFADRIAELIDWSTWEADYAQQEDERGQLNQAATRWDELNKFFEETSS